MVSEALSRCLEEPQRTAYLQIKFANMQMTVFQAKCLPWETFKLSSPLATHKDAVSAARTFRPRSISAIQPVLLKIQSKIVSRMDHMNSMSNILYATPKCITVKLLCKISSSIYHIQCNNFSSIRYIATKVNYRKSWAGVLYSRARGIFGG